MSDSITLRSHLTGNLNDLVESAAIGPLGKSSIVCELVSLFVDYREEGTTLFLDAFLTNSLDKLIAPIPQHDHVCLGTTTCDEAGVKKAVKKAAPLVRDCWRMYLAGSDNNIEFGVFRDSGHPLNVPLGLALQAEANGESKFIRVTRLAQDSVKVSCHKGTVKVIHFTNATEGVADANQSISDLCDVICADLEEAQAQSCKTYVASLLSTALRQSHGALIAVARPTSKVKFLSDCTKLNPVIDLNAAVQAVKLDSSAIPKLHAVEHLVCGMFGCDGIVLFDTQARIVAYNCFVKLQASNVVGGARRRAYQAMCTRVGNGIRAAFYQSQDGASELRRAN